MGSWSRQKLPTIGRVVGFLLVIAGVVGWIKLVSELKVERLVRDPRELFF